MAEQLFYGNVTVLSFISAAAVSNSVNNLFSFAFQTQFLINTVFSRFQEDNQASDDPVAKDWESSFIEIIHGEKRPEGLPEGATMEGVAERR